MKISKVHSCITFELNPTKVILKRRTTRKIKDNYRFFLIIKKNSDQVLILNRMGRDYPTKVHPIPSYSKLSHSMHRTWLQVPKIFVPWTWAIFAQVSSLPCYMGHVFVSFGTQNPEISVPRLEISRDPSPVAHPCPILSVIENLVLGLE